jgi:chromosome segregation and condensation protein ScpB
MKKAKEYITFERFKEYFELPESLDLKGLENVRNEKLKRERSSN